jgi:hypothetical protein
MTLGLKPSAAPSSADIISELDMCPPDARVRNVQQHASRSPKRAVTSSILPSAKFQIIKEALCRPVRCLASASSSQFAMPDAEKYFISLPSVQNNKCGAKPRLA